MDISLVKLVLLLAGLVAYGRPDGWDVAVQARLSFHLPGPVGSAGLAVDPIPIYYRRLDGDLCGLYWGPVVVDPEAGRKGCENTLEHELAHAWQARSYGLIQPITYALSPPLWEPERPWGEVPASPHVLEWALVRFWWPLSP